MDKKTSKKEYEEFLKLNNLYHNDIVMLRKDLKVSIVGYHKVMGCENRLMFIGCYLENIGSWNKSQCDEWDYVADDVESYNELCLVLPEEIMRG